jgi:hypothetical protein
VIGGFKAPASPDALAWALAYAEAGMAVFPCNAQKKPLCAHGLKDATTDEATIRGWWGGKWPHAEIGWAVPANIAVLDLDVGRNIDGYKDFVEHVGVSPDEFSTPQASTPRGGRHMVCDANGANYKNGVRINGAAIDVRTVGGYIILPRPGSRREWIMPPTTALAPVPDFIPERPSSRPPPPPPGAEESFSGKTSAYARAALDKACKAIATAENGEQESTLNKECFSIGGLVGAQLDKETAITRLTAAALRMPAYAGPWGDLAAKVRRSVEEGMLKPREHPNGGEGSTANEEGARSGTEDAKEAASEDAYPFKWHSDPDETPLKDWGVEGMLPKIGKALMVGQWGVYKTFVALDLSYSFMTKTPFAGREVHRQGGVLFIAAEGQNEVRVRLAGIAREKAAKLVEREGVVTVDPEHAGSSPAPRRRCSSGSGCPWSRSLSIR